MEKGRQWQSRAVTAYHVAVKAPAEQVTVAAGVDHASLPPYSSKEVPGHVKTLEAMRCADVNG